MRRIAWRLQANGQGDLSERARQREMALAQEADHRDRRSLLLAGGRLVVSNYAALAQLARVRSRITQMTGLLNLAPDIQEEILFLQSEEAQQFRISEPAVRKTECGYALEPATGAVEKFTPVHSESGGPRAVRTSVSVAPNIQEAITIFLGLRK